MYGNEKRHQWFSQICEETMISQYKQRKGQKMMTYIMVNYPLIYALVKGNPPGLSYEGWRAIYKELCR